MNLKILTDLSQNRTENVTAIANTLKTKSTIPALELVKLKNALLQDHSNIEVVLNVHGALRGLVITLSINVLRLDVYVTLLLEILKLVIVL
ncbi:unnamed protein product [Leptidea sinapis]|uniref:Uncharacterized protein n=1 Tax=Leptidea sinapis TaxID=189913 RepID=A0A5E4R640_9NEOP|nr:unnamed protein product [Leptidea sinapis]